MASNPHTTQTELPPKPVMLSLHFAEGATPGTGKAAIRISKEGVGEFLTDDCSDMAEFEELMTCFEKAMAGLREAAREKFSGTAVEK